MKNKAGLLLLIFGFFLLIVVGCGQREKKNRGDEVVAKIDDMTITVSEVARALEKLKSGIQSEEPINPEQEKQIKLNILQQLIEKKILIKEAESLGITVSKEEIDKEVEAIIGEYPDTDEFNKKVAEMNINIEEWKKEIEYQLMLNKLIKSVAPKDIVITPEEIERYYNEHRDEFNAPRRVHALQIMVETMAEAEKALKRLAGGEDFSTLAGSISISPDAQNGGDLGYFGEEEMPPDFEIVFSMKVNDISGIIESPYGFHIFKVLDIREAKDMTLDEAKPEIESNIRRMKMEEEYGTWFKEAMTKVKIEVNIPLLDSIQM